MSENENIEYISTIRENVPKYCFNKKNQYSLCGHMFRINEKVKKIEYDKEKNPEVKEVYSVTGGRRVSSFVLFFVYLLFVMAFEFLMWIFVFNLIFTLIMNIIITLIGIYYFGSLWLILGMVNITGSVAWYIGNLNGTDVPIITYFISIFPIQTILIISYFIYSFRSAKNQKLVTIPESYGYKFGGEIPDSYFVSKFQEYTEGITKDEKQVILRQTPEDAILR